MSRETAHLIINRSYDGNNDYRNQQFTLAIITIIGALVIICIVLIMNKDPRWLITEMGPGALICNALRRYYGVEKANKNTHVNSNKTLAKEQEQLVMIANLREDRAKNA